MTYRCDERGGWPFQSCQSRVWLTADPRMQTLPFDICPGVSYWLQKKKLSFTKQTLIKYYLDTLANLRHDKIFVVKSWRLTTTWNLKVDCKLKWNDFSTNLENNVLRPPRPSHKPECRCSSRPGIMDMVISCKRGYGLHARVPQPTLPVIRTCIYLYTVLHVPVYTCILRVCEPLTTRNNA